MYNSLFWRINSMERNSNQRNIDSLIYFSKSLNISSTITGFALPLESCITFPTKNCIILKFPFLNCSTSFAESFTTWVHSLISSPLSLSCKSPFSSMICFGVLLSPFKIAKIVCLAADPDLFGYEKKVKNLK